MVTERMQLAPKQLRFVEEYLIDLNGTQAAIRAGYSAAAAKVTASRLLTDANVASSISALRNKMSKKLELTTEKVLSELAKIGFANIADFYRADGRGNLAIDVHALTDAEKAAAIAQLDVQTSPDGTQTIKLKLADKKGALIELGKYLGLGQGSAEMAATQRDGAETDPRRLALAVLAMLRDAEEASRLNPLTVRRQNIWHNSRRKLAECGPRPGVDIKRRSCGAASADVRWSSV